MTEQVKQKKIKELLLLIGVLAVAALLIWLAFGDTIIGLGRLLFHGNEAEMEQYLKSGGQWKGIISVILLAVLQVISIFLPGFAIQIAAGVIYGWWKALLICYAGYVIGNVLVFAVVRRLGNHLNGIVPTFGKSAGDKSNWLIEKMRSTRPTVVVAVANLLPVIPNGIIPYTAAGSPIRQIRFTEALMATCWVQIFFNCLAGGFLKRGKILFMVFALAIQIVILILVALKGNQIVEKLLGNSGTNSEK